jgi:predicted metal-binding protein
MIIMDIILREIKYDQIVFVTNNKDIHTSCRKPFKGNPDGCPNYGKTWNCPPYTPELADTKNKIRNREHHFLLIGIEDINTANKTDVKGKYGKIVENMNQKIREIREKDPDSLCFHGPSCRYCIEEEIAECNCPSEPCRFPTVWTYPPEAVGIDVFQTMLNAGIKMQKNPTDVVYRVGLICLSDQIDLIKFTKYINQLLSV